MIELFEIAVGKAKELLAAGFSVNISPDISGVGWIVNASISIKESLPPQNT